MNEDIVQDKPCTNCLNLFSTKSIKFPIKSLDLLYHNLPNIRAVYGVQLKDKIIYIGKADQLKNRWKSHHRFYDFNLLLDLGLDLNFSYIESIDFDPLSTKEFEWSLIQSLKPVLNYRVYSNNYCSIDQVIDTVHKTNKEWQQTAINCIRF